MRSIFAVTDACAGCGACIKTCPEKAIRPAPRDHGSPLIVLEDRCSGCAECAEVCPVSACVEVAPLRSAPGSSEPLAPLAGRVGSSNSSTSYLPPTTHRGERSDDQ